MFPYPPVREKQKRMDDVNLMAGLCSHPRRVPGVRLLPRNDVLLCCNVPPHYRPIPQAQVLLY